MGRDVYIVNERILLMFTFAIVRINYKLKK